MKSKLKNNYKFINWDKTQLLVSDNNKIVLTNGISTNESFTGTLIYTEDNDYEVGYISETWDKEFFNILPSNKQIELSN